MSRLLTKAYQECQDEGMRHVCRRACAAPFIKLTDAVTAVNRRYYRQRSDQNYNSNGISIFNEDWDNLIILDACRYDIFAQYNHLEGDLESRISRASTTKEFIRSNFQDEQLYDTAYISDNPWYGRLHDEINSDIYYYEICDRDAFDGAVTHPETVTNTAINYNEEYDDKRLLVHYLQPHAPYFDEEGGEQFFLESNCPQGLTAVGYSRDDIVSAYVQNLKLVLSEVERLVAHLEGKTVITADHGELLGERMRPLPVRRYEHPEGIYMEELVRVPWFIVDSEGRKDITTANRPERWDVTDPDRDEVEEQLKKLGYLS